MNISVVIVKYRSGRYLPQCLESVNKEKPYEVIVVDNDKENRGYGGGCNYGAGKASGDIILFLNPDVKLTPGSLQAICNIFEKNNKVGVVGPKLYTDDTLNTVQLSCSRKAGFITSLIVYGKLQKYFSTNPWWNNYTYKAQLADGKPFQVSVVSGAAIAVKNSVFIEIGGFDPNIFLYFEENDLCLRATEAGYQIIYLPASKVIHYGGGSMGNKQLLDKVYAVSRNYFFTKHYPKCQAWLLNLLLK